MAAPLDLDLIRTFVAVAETGSFTAAAPRINRSQSAISMQMQRLEQTVGKSLLIRTPRSVRPNSAGTDFLVYARRLLTLSDEAWASVTRPDEMGTVRLGVPDDYASFILPQVLSRFANAHPFVTVQVVCEPSIQLVKAFEAGKLDVAIVTRLPSQPYAVLRREPFVWVASPNHIAWQQDPLPVALFDAGCCARINVVQALGDAQRRYRSAYSSASLLGLIAVVEAGLAVAGLALCSVPTSLQIVGEKEGLPSLQSLELSLLHDVSSSVSAVHTLSDFLRRDLMQHVAA